VSGNKQDNTPDCEIVGLYADRNSFESAVNALVASRFERSDLSVLSSHESLEAAGSPGKPWKDVLVALVGELKYEGSLVASGAILLAGGPMAQTISGLIAAAVGGVAIKDVLGEVTAVPHTEHFARSLEAGSVILWVRAASLEDETRAIEILTQTGASNVHVHTPKNSKSV
jgi:hypothetical protein